MIDDSSESKAAAKTAPAEFLYPEISTSPERGDPAFN